MTETSDKEIAEKKKAMVLQTLPVTSLLLPLKGVVLIRGVLCRFALVVLRRLTESCQTLSGGGKLMCLHSCRVRIGVFGRARIHTDRFVCVNVFVIYG